MVAAQQGVERTRPLGSQDELQADGPMVPDPALPCILDGSIDHEPHDHERRTAEPHLGGLEPGRLNARPPALDPHEARDHEDEILEDAPESNRIVVFEEVMQREHHARTSGGALQCLEVVDVGRSLERQQYDQCNVGDRHDPPKNEVKDRHHGALFVCFRHHRRKCLYLSQKMAFCQYATSLVDFTGNFR